MAAGDDVDLGRARRRHRPGERRDRRRFAAQLLTGALSYLIPSVMGGGKTVVRAGQAWFDRGGTARLVVVNGGLALTLLPVPSWVRVVVSALVLVALAVFVPLMVGAIRATVAAKREVEEARARGERPAGATPTPGLATGAADRLPSVWSGGQLVAAVSALLLAVSVGVAIDPAAAGLRTTAAGQVAGAGPGEAAGGEVTPTGRTTTVQVEAVGMRFEPSTVEVPLGDRLVVELTNTDATNVHDLQLLGERTPRLAAGESASIDVGVVTGPTQAGARSWATARWGWCSTSRSPAGTAWTRPGRPTGPTALRRTAATPRTAATRPGAPPGPARHTPPRPRRRSTRTPASRRWSTRCCRRCRRSGCTG
ncbi:hypothetical protein [Ornithinimicrobium sp. CNJ-824]|uniref:hypothetical protein n=1 Tax=Ornithinimicrobium sp. CNJ-824 TaxID=1904966 RepID=UPI0031597241